MTYSSTDSQNVSATTTATKTDRVFALLSDMVIIFIVPFVVMYFLIKEEDITARLLSNTERVQFFCFLLKDVFGVSPGKAIWGLKIVRKTDFAKRPNPFVLVFRNVFFLFGIVEGIVLLASAKGQRIADMVTDSIVVKSRHSKSDHDTQNLVEVFPDDTSEATVCVSCGGLIPEDQTSCSACGWSYRGQGL